MKDDDGSYLWERCYSCGHRLAFSSDSCPQCGIHFDGRKDPKKWPETCACERCTKARSWALDRLAQANAHRPKLWKCPDCHVRCRIENAPNHADTCRALGLAAAEDALMPEAELMLNGPASGAPAAVDERSLTERATAESTGTLKAERDRLRAALVGLVGVDGHAELEQMEAVMRLMPVPAEDKAATIDAIHALLATCKRETRG